MADEWGMRDDEHGTFRAQLAPHLYTRSENNRAITFLSPGVKEHCLDAAGADRMKCVW